VTTVLLVLDEPYVNKWQQDHTISPQSCRFSFLFMSFRFCPRGKIAGSFPQILRISGLAVHGPKCSMNTALSYLNLT
jgi:hypothetical protein